MTQDGADNPARPPPGQRLCALADIPDPGAKGFRFRVEAKLFAGFVVCKAGVIRGFVDSCPHAGWPLSSLDDRYLTRGGDRILCAGHGAVFRIEDGVCLAGPCSGEMLEPWPVTVRDGNIVTD